MSAKLLRRVFCPQCGAMRVRHGRSPYAVCPYGHGKLVRRFTKVEEREAVEAKLPRARRAGGRKFTIDGHEGLFGYRNGNGRRRAQPGNPVDPGEVIARHETDTRRLVRLFSPLEGNNVAGPDQQLDQSRG